MRINVHELAMSMSSFRKDMLGEKAINYNYTYDITRFGIWQNFRFIFLKIDIVKALKILRRD